MLRSRAWAARTSGPGAAILRPDQSARAGAARTHLRLRVDRCSRSGSSLKAPRPDAGILSKRASPCSYLSFVLASDGSGWGSCAELLIGGGLLPCNHPPGPSINLNGQAAVPPPGDRRVKIGSRTSDLFTKQCGCRDPRRKFLKQTSPVIYQTALHAARVRMPQKGATPPTVSSIPPNVLGSDAQTRPRI